MRVDATSIAISGWTDVEESHTDDNPDLMPCKAEDAVCHCDYRNAFGSSLDFRSEWKQKNSWREIAQRIRADEGIHLRPATEFVDTPGLLVCRLSVGVQITSIRQRG